jgi:hypothetical protein
MAAVTAQYRQGVAAAMAAVTAQVMAQYRQEVVAAMAAVRVLVTAMVAAVTLVLVRCRLVKAPLGVVTPVTQAM